MFVMAFCAVQRCAAGKLDSKSRWLNRMYSGRHWLHMSRICFTPPLADLRNTQARNCKSDNQIQVYILLCITYIYMYATLELNSQKRLVSGLDQWKHSYNNLISIGAKMPRNSSSRWFSNWRLKVDGHQSCNRSQLIHRRLVWRHLPNESWYLILTGQHVMYYMVGIYLYVGWSLWIIVIYQMVWMIICRYSCLHPSNGRNMPNSGGRRWNGLCYQWWNYGHPFAERCTRERGIASERLCRWICWECRPLPSEFGQALCEQFMHRAAPPSTTAGKAGWDVAAKVQGWPDMTTRICDVYNQPSPAIHESDMRWLYVNIYQKISKRYCPKARK